MAKCQNNSLTLAILLVIGILFEHTTLATDSTSELHRNIAWQVALDRIGFSPGVIDGKIGPKTVLATMEFQRVRGFAISGSLDQATQGALGVDAHSAIVRHTIDPIDFADIGHTPKDWLERSKLRKLGYSSVDEAIAERFHCTRGLIQRLNPGIDLASLKIGDTVNVPNVIAATDSRRGSIIQIDLDQKVIRVLDREKHLLAVFHCSIAAKKEKRPSGDAAVKDIAHNPDYLFDPKMWPEVKNVNRKLVIPPGPRNPVGRCWIGLTLPGYGIHGTPHPEMIGKTGSHGCFRLTNWDAVRLGKLISVGTPVRFLSKSVQPVLASAN